MDKCLIRTRDKVINLSKGEIDLIVDVCNNWVKQTTKTMNLFDEAEMIRNILLIEVIDEVKYLIDKIKGRL